MIKQIATVVFAFSLAYASDYFQQYVNYDINARLLHLHNSIEATQKLSYVNNSRDTLKQVYFHLYFNKYLQGAYTESNKLRPNTQAYIIINALKVNDKLSTDYDIYKTLMQVNLEEPLLPSDTVNFYFEFKSCRFNIDNQSAWSLIQSLRI